MDSTEAPTTIHYSAAPSSDWRRLLTNEREIPARDVTPGMYIEAVDGEASIVTSSEAFSSVWTIRSADDGGFAGVNYSPGQMVRVFDARA